jgi:hypothetical protein
VLQLGVEFHTSTAGRPEDCAPQARLLVGTAASIAPKANTALRNLVH